MSNVSATKKVSDMTAGELRDLIHDTIYSIIDPDYGLELRPEFEQELRESLAQKEEGKFYTTSEVNSHLGI
jgi:hypothetical protein